jgi:ABC-2 type transport system permease protein
MAAESIPQGRLFRWLRGRLLWHGWSVLLQTAKARLITIVICTLLIAGVVAVGAFEGFWLMKQQALPGTGLIVGLLFDFLFMTLGLMLIFSGGLILYGSLFSAPEATFLLATPARADQVFGHKFLGAIGFSSWAFVLLGVPVLGAYGIVYGVHWLFWPALLLFLLGFVLIPGSIGAIACLLIVNLAPRHRKHLLVVTIVGIVAAVVILAYRFILSAVKADVSDRDALTGLLSQLSFARTIWMPSHWMTQGLHAAVRGDFWETLYPLAMVWSNGLVLYLVAALVAGRIYRSGFNRLQTGGDLRKRFGGSRVDEWLERSMGFLDRKTQLLIIKDFRTFRRDPGQWAQVLIFAGLGLTYFANSRQFYRSDLGRSFQHGVSLVNLLATCLLLCAYMGRFIYPMLSLEGRKFWILGLMPLERRRLLIGKFIFAVVGSIIIAGPLVLAADLLLGLPISAMVLHALTIMAVASGLSGLSVGIGAVLPNFRETDPSKIAVGFGGTMNLLAGLLFLLVEIALISGPYHMQAMLGHDGGGTIGQRWLETGSALVGLGLAVAVTLIPLRLGTKSLEAMEF